MEKLCPIANGDVIPTCYGEECAWFVNGCCAIVEIANQLGNVHAAIEDLTNAQQ